VARAPALNRSDADLALQIRGLNKRFGQQVVLRNVDLRVGQGQFVCLLGASGCGKSTLLRLIAGLESLDRPEQSPPRRSADSGSLQLTSRSGGTPRLGFVFQQPNLLPWRTVGQNVGLPLQLQGVPGRLRKERVQAALQQVGLAAQVQSHWPRMLSGGMQMRASLARALVTQPELLLLDEPFSALDEVLRQRLGEELRQWHAQHRWTTVFVTHHVSEAVFLADRIVVFRNLTEAADTDTVAADISIPLGPQRDRELRESHDYLEWVVQVTRKFREITE